MLLAARPRRIAGRLFATPNAFHEYYRTLPCAAEANELTRPPRAHSPVSHTRHLQSTGNHGGSSTLRSALLPLLVRRGVAAYFSGHDHMLALSHGSGVDCLVSGGGSFLRARDTAPDAADAAAERWSALAHGFAITSINATHIQHTFITVGQGDTGELASSDVVAFPARALPARAPLL